MKLQDCSRPCGVSQNFGQGWMSVRPGYDGSTEHHDCTAGWGAYESLKQDAALGTTYQVTVEWEDGASTVRNVNFHTSG